MAIPELNAPLTEKHWKDNGLPKRTGAERVKNEKTGVSEALRHARECQNVCVRDPFVLSSAVALQEALGNLKTTIKNVEASDKGLQNLLNDMAQAIADYVSVYNARVQETLSMTYFKDNKKAWTYLLVNGEKEFNDDALKFLSVIEGPKISEKDLLTLYDLFIASSASDRVSLSSDLCGTWNALVEKLREPNATPPQKAVMMVKLIRVAKDLTAPYVERYVANDILPRFRQRLTLNLA